MRSMASVMEPPFVVMRIGSPSSFAEDAREKRVPPSSRSKPTERTTSRFSISR